LGERLAEKLVPTGEAAESTISFVPSDARIEVVPRHEVHELSEH
jgi:hypothetical protein